MSTMSRREFLALVGVAASGAAIGCAPSGSARSAGGATPRSEPAAEATAALKALGWGMACTNPHNTQPWKIRMLSDREFLVHVDGGRLLPMTDPPARQIHIGTGVFLEQIAIGATGVGMAASIDLLPEGESPLEDVGRFPVAHVTLREAAIGRDPLFDQIPRRRTSRLPYHPGSFTEADRAALAQVGEGFHSRLETHLGAELADMLDLSLKGMEVECRTRRTYEESRVWFRVDEERMAELRDGITLEGNGVRGLRKWMVAMYLGEAREDRWHAKSSIDKYMSDFSEVLSATPALVSLSSPSNTRRDQLLTGRDLARLSLAASARDLHLHPLSQTLQEFPEMDDLRSKMFATLRAGEGRQPQMLLRIGRSDLPWQSWRRFPRQLVVG